MKPFNLRPAFIEKPAQGQQALGGHNSANNCVPDSALECYQALTGKWPCNPQDITTAVYSAGYVGGETFTKVIGFLRSRKDLFPLLPDVEIHDFDSKAPVDLIGEYGAQGFPMAASFYADANGVILPHWSSILHASCPVASDGVWVWIWNVEGYEIRLSLADFTRAYQGALCIFKRSVHQREAEMELLIGDGNGGVDPLGKGAVYITNGQTKRHCLSQSEVDAWTKIIGHGVATFDQGALDRIPVEETVAIGAAGSVVIDWLSLLGKIEGLKAAVLARSDPSAVTGKLDAIKASLDQLRTGLHSA